MSVNTLALLLQQSQPGGIGSMIGPFVPMILIFAVFQRRFIQGIALTGVKG